MHRIIICDLCGSTIFFNIIQITAGFSKKATENKTCFDFLYYFGQKYFSFQEELREV
jgi:hypothetical protein